MLTEPDYTEHALHMAEIAGHAARSHFRGALGVEFKSDESPVTQADRAVEAEIRAYLTSHFPDHGIFGEEHGIEGGDRDHLWIIDPIDGTRSFLTGHPLFGFLLGHLLRGRVELGVIGMPALHEIYVGARDKPATLNGTPIHCSDQTELGSARLYVNEGDKIHRDHPNLFARLMSAGQTRRFAYDCYPHALLASGHVDAVIDYDLQPYDFLPVSQVIASAGGIMTDWQGDPLTLQSDGRTLSAATPDLHAQLIDLVNG